MKFVKLFTSETFDNRTFARLLERQMNVRAKAVEDGVILDRDAFNSWPAGEMPVWAFVNKADINSPLHTREAQPDEWPDIQGDAKFQIAIRWSDCATEAGKVPGKSGALRLAQDLADELHDKDGFISVMLIDLKNHKILHEYTGRA